MLKFCSTDQEKSYCFIYRLDILKTYQRETKLFEFPRDTSREALKI